MKIGLIITLCFSLFAISPPSDTWEVLSELKFDIRFDEELDDVVFTPKPSKAIKRLIGKEITLQAFKSSLFEEDSDSKTNKIYLCRYKTQIMDCCGGYGAEAYIEVQTDEKIEIKEGKPYVIKGVFELNTKDYLNLPFILKDAECLNCEE